MSGPWRTVEDDPVVMQPELAELVDLARNQRLPTLRTSAAMVSTEVEAHARGRRRTWLAVAGISAVAAALLVSVVPRALDRREAAAANAAVDDEVTTPSGGRSHASGDAGTAEPVVEPRPTVEPAPAADTSPAEPPPTDPDAPPSAAELARAAERSMAAGRRDETIRLLIQLVRRYPKSSPARAALFDLGRLLRASGRNDEARCVYRALRQRWPQDAMRGEIDRVLESLGDGPECRGLQPVQ